ncbi:MULTISPECIES: N-methyl-D-aspartate receptor NMDAR2C subunit [unclassified Pseudomonas]|uniref:HD domain-containing protein n=1 Tax=unclassified Pseudomonas TaxID=196821 RepID=UPI00244882C6|nr:MULTISPECIES: N-methyl-D-aspartate receptor NMDAR2C subunit [unclassified Pseudomonas]MDG9926998.1 N-methyl-D-aspartate receptor NMDAR2C subunit [Pseudomonas sp. GD04042]MDH0485909.1 N-methyl-D-aspartate receptor NMDAR2C subunit [Pseudomonas sp. GD04015]MDH0602413.1 N-methyl-D-aspartate receptor NMDAR2C subunit [Pseudomonas sp. GD03869]
MKENTLQFSWERCWLGMGAKGDGIALMRRLLAAYAEPQRRYHTVQHLSECLALLEIHLELAAEPAEVEMALWFHDAVYDVKGADNELKSAEWAEAELSEAGVSAERIARVSNHILATRHTALPEGQDQMLLVDIDLSILGAPRPRFEEYERQVREEYGWVPDPLFRGKRQTILEEFLHRSPIYSTRVLREALEGRARENLAYSLRLSGR